jgi:hypothetical protein
MRAMPRHPNPAELAEAARLAQSGSCAP